MRYRNESRGKETVWKRLFESLEWLLTFGKRSPANKCVVMVLEGDASGSRKNGRQALSPSVIDW